jgi:hypothetical protein
MQDRKTEEPIQDSPEPGQDMFKHLSIIHALDRLGEVRNEAERLLCKITGAERSKQSEEPLKNMPTLAVTISTSGNQIADLSEQISDILRGIEGELF